MTWTYEENEYQCKLLTKVGNLHSLYKTLTYDTPCLEMLSTCLVNLFQLFISKLMVRGLITHDLPIASDSRTIFVNKKMIRNPAKPLCAL